MDNVNHTRKRLTLQELLEGTEGVEELNRQLAATLDGPNVGREILDQSRSDEHLRAPEPKRP